MATKKLSKKALKQPDQFVGFWQGASMKVGRFAGENAKALVIGISALATVVVGMVVLSWVNEGRAGRASAALGQAEKIPRTRTWRRQGRPRRPIPSRASRPKRNVWRAR